MIKQLAKNVYQDTTGDTVSFKNGNLTFTALERDLSVVVDMINTHYRKGAGTYLAEIGNIVTYLAPAIYNEMVAACPDLNVPVLIVPLVSGDGFSLTVKWLRTRKNLVDTEHVSVRDDGLADVLTLLQYPQIDVTITNMIPLAKYRSSWCLESVTGVLKGTYDTLCDWYVSGDRRFRLVGDPHTVFDWFAVAGNINIYPDSEISSTGNILQIEADDSLVKSIIGDVDGDVLIDGDITDYLSDAHRMTNNYRIDKRAMVITNMWLMANKDTDKYTFYQQLIHGTYIAMWGVVKYDQHMAMMKEVRL